MTNGDWGKYDVPAGGGGADGGGTTAPHPPPVGEFTP